MKALYGLSQQEMKKLQDLRADNNTYVEEQIAMI